LPAKFPILQQYRADCLYQAAIHRLIHSHIP
jgi:hypothetical protein